MAARAEKIDTRVLLKPPQVEKSYIAELKDFSFDVAFERAQTKSGYWFKAQSGDTFALFVGRGREGEAERASTSLYMLQTDGLMRLAGFLDVKISKNGEGPRAECLTPLAGTAPGNEYITAADAARARTEGVGFWTDDTLSKSKEKGGRHSGFGRFLLTVQGIHAKNCGAKSFLMCTPTASEREILYDFYSKKGAKTLTVFTPDKEGHYQLSVDLSEVNFGSEPPRITVNGLPGMGVAHLKEKFETELLPFSGIVVNEAFIARAMSNDGCRIRTSQGIEFAIFLRERGLSLEGHESAVEMTVSVFHVADRKIFVTDGLGSARRMFRRQRIDIMEERRMPDGAMQFTDTVGNVYKAEEDGGMLTVYACSDLIPAAFCDRTISKRKGSAAYSEMYGPPVTGSDTGNGHINEMDAELRKKAPKDPDSGLPLPQGYGTAQKYSSHGKGEGYGTAKRYSSHARGEFSGVGRFALALQEKISKLRGVGASYMFISDVETEEGRKWLRSIYANPDEAIKTGSAVGMVEVDLTKAVVLLPEPVPVRVQTTLEEIK